MQSELRTRNLGPALLRTITRLLSITSVITPTTRGGLRSLLDLALQFPDLPLVPDLLGLHVPLVRLHLPELLSEFEVAGLHVGYPLEQIPVEFFRVLGFLWLPGGLSHLLPQIGI